MNIEQLLDLGSGYVAEPISRADETIGLLITGPRAPSCRHVPQEAEPARCGGCVFFEGRGPHDRNRPEWKVESEQPLTLSPSIQCHCGGQHGHIRESRWENAGGIVE